MDESEMVGYERVDAYSSDYSFKPLRRLHIGSEGERYNTHVSNYYLEDVCNDDNKGRVRETTNYDKKVENLVIASESSHLVKLTGLKHSTATISACAVRTAIRTTLCPMTTHSQPCSIRK
jgi:hypothetical protein